MRHNLTGPFSVAVVPGFRTATLCHSVNGGLRKARQLAKASVETGQENAAFAIVKDVTGRPVFECRNIHGKAIQVGYPQESLA